MVGQAMLRQKHTGLCKQGLPSRPAVHVPASRRCSVSVKAEAEQGTDRRAVLGLLAGVAALGFQTSPAQAAFGEGANIFGKPTNTTGLIPYQGKGFSVDLPARWTVSHEEDTPNVLLRYEDTGDQINSVTIFKVKGGSVSDPKSFLKDNSYLFGQNVWLGATESEGGFKKNQVSSANLLNAYTESKNGKQYTKMEVLTRTADGNEGGKHQLITATSSGGDLWVCRIQVGEKRWFKGANKFGKAVFDSFTVA